MANYDDCAKGCRAFRRPGMWRGDLEEEASREDWTEQVVDLGEDPFEEHEHPETWIL